MTSETLIRLGVFLGILVIMGLLEVMAPRRPPSVSKARRWFCNLGIVVVDTIVVRLAVPAAAVGAAVMAQQNEWGILNQFAIPTVFAYVASVVILDLLVYFQHVAFHAFPVLWRVHRMHHSDRDLDASSGLRFHPIEIVLSMVIKMLAVISIGAPAGAVLIFEVLLNATAVFNHSNVSIPNSIDRVLRWILVTPDMHRVHHSVVPIETDCNFGFNLPWWDRLFGTYQPQPAAGHEGMVVGLADYQDDRPQRLSWMLVFPFLSETAFRGRKDIRPE
ncbi:MAG: sterol desaturase family protein [Candidatus Hydrogenedentes bacterium]|nr:sterol desaturase family protein [Candidatus Hydrogenedentota bacterium]